MRIDFDLVSIEVQMPVMDSLDATRRHASLHPGKQLHMVTVTANAMDSGS